MSWKTDWKAYGKFSGPYLSGGSQAPLFVTQPGDSFLYRVLWLTTQVECGGRYGVINMSDGSGITAGLIQAIATYPRDLGAQGPLFKLLGRVNQAMDINIYIGQLLAERDWVLTPSGVLTDRGGKPIKGGDFRKVVSPVDGVVPKDGAHRQTAERWCVGFHSIFSHPDSFRVQVRYGLEFFEKVITRRKAIIHYALDRVLRSGTLQDLALSGFTPNAIKPFRSDECDLAYAFMLSNVVNAPTLAFSAFEKALEVLVMKQYATGMSIEALSDSLPSIAQSPEFARELIVMMTRMRDRWDDDVKSSRYQRSRTAAMTQWPSSFFEPGGIMAADLPG